ncbi:MAG: DUF6326 family protein [Promethearchaeota archaeon]
MEDVKIKLSILWITRLLTGFVGDIIRFLEPGKLEQIISGEIWGGIPMTNELLLLITLITVIPAVMVFPSLTLPDKANRWVNLIVGIFMVGFDLVFLITAILTVPAYEIFLGILYLVFTALIVWYAWKWPKQEE